jgi:hypothetical protein
MVAFKKILNAYSFGSLDELRYISDDWMICYNFNRLTATLTAARKLSKDSKSNNKLKQTHKPNPQHPSVL